VTRFDPTAARQLEYEQRRASLRRRRIATLGAVIILLSAVTPFAVRYARMAAERWRVNRLYRDCAAHVSPVTTVVWEEDVEQVKRLRSAGAYEIVGSHHGDAAYLVPPKWRELNAAIGQQIQTWGTLFLHERATPQAKRKLLVGVDIAGWSRGGPVVLFARVRTIAPAAPIRLPRQAKVDHPSVVLATTDSPLRLFAGQADPNDASHFTIDYAFGDAKGVVDGWLKEDGSVLLEKREINDEIRNQKSESMTKPE
jgi:hypothetical protein